MLVWKRNLLLWYPGSRLTPLAAGSLEHIEHWKHGTVHDQHGLSFQALWYFASIGWYHHEISWIWCEAFCCTKQASLVKGAVRSRRLRPVGSKENHFWLNSEALTVDEPFNRGKVADNFSKIQRCELLLMFFWLQQTQKVTYEMLISFVSLVALGLQKSPVFSKRISATQINRRASGIWCQSTPGQIQRIKYEAANE